MTLLTLLVSLGVLLSACSISAVPSDKLTEDSLENLVAVENPGGLATAAIADGLWVCLYTDADFQGQRQCYVDNGPEGEGQTSGFFKDAQLPEFLNDNISSVEISPKVAVIRLHTDAELQGDFFELTADSNYIGDEFNDTVSSVTISVP